MKYFALTIKMVTIAIEREKKNQIKGSTSEFIDPTKSIKIVRQHTALQLNIFTILLYHNRNSLSANTLTKRSKTKRNQRRDEHNLSIVREQFMSSFKINILQF